MSDSVSKNEVPEAVVTEPKEEFVPKKAYSDVSKDMHNYKAKLKETEAKLSQLQADAEAREKQVLLDNEQYKALYEQTQAKLTEVASTRKQEQEKFINYHKKNAILKEVGGFKKDDYSKFINIDAVEMDESGSINAESLASEVNRIKQEYPELLKASPVQNLPNGAPKPFVGGEKDYSTMSASERMQLKNKLVVEKQKK